MIFDADTREVLDLVRGFVDKELIPKVGEIEKNDNEGLEELLDKAVAMGLNALCVPAEFGGPGFTNVQTFAIAEEIARGDIGVARPSSATVWPLTRCCSPARRSSRSTGSRPCWRRSGRPSV